MLLKKLNKILFYLFIIIYIVVNKEKKIKWDTFGCSKYKDDLVNDSV